MSGALDDYRWLVSDAAEPWLAEARAELLEGGCGSRSERRPRGVSVGLVFRLRKELSAERAHLIVEQVELRQRGREKFTLAERMFFTRKGLEQATDEQVAAYKAGRFAAGGRTLDLCCGIGGDLVALARHGSAVGVDLDSVSVLLAEINAAAHGLDHARCRIVVADATQADVAAEAAWHCDPDRRASGKRTTRADYFQPPLESLDRLLTANSAAAIKLAPATDAPQPWQDLAELEWLGSRGECRQQVAWFGWLARHPGCRSATVVDARGGARTVFGRESPSVPVAAGLGRCLYEPHAAVLAANLTGVLAQEHGLAAVSPAVAYLTGDGPIDDPALAAFEVVDHLPLDRRQLRAYCREHNLGRLEVKKRGVAIEPEMLRKQVVGQGSNEATLIVTRVGGAVRVVIAHRLTSGAGEGP